MHSKSTISLYKLLKPIKYPKQVFLKHIILFFQFYTIQMSWLKSKYDCVMQTSLKADMIERFAMF